MINKNVNAYIECTMIGILQSAAWLANVADEPTFAKDLIKAEIIDLSLADLDGCKEIAMAQDIDLEKVWKGERFP